MLTSIKEAFDNERYYDAVSNNINSTIVDYSKPSDLQKESKVIVEDSYKDLKPSINVLKNHTIYLKLFLKKLIQQWIK